MTHEQSSAGQHFADDKWQRLQTQDIQASKAIVSLMAGIFVIGLVLYLIVAWSVT